MPETPIIAAIVHRAQGGVDDLIASFALAQIARGRKVRGLVQETCTSDDECRITLVDLDDGSCYPITQRLGRHALSCRLDLAQMAEASTVMRRIAEQGAELAVFNRFSTQEADGRGFAAEMLDLAVRGIPVLTIIPERHLAAWRKFTGGLGSELEARHTALEAWFDDINGRSPGQAHTQTIHGGMA